MNADEKTADALELVSKIEEMVRIKQPLFEATVNKRGQIVIPEWVRKRYGFEPTKAIQSKKHDLLVTSTAQNNVNETPTNVFIKCVGTGYYIASHDSDLYYAYFSTRMKCAKMCANAVLKVFEKP